MHTSQDIINEKNYILREIKDIKGKENINPQNIEIIENYTEIHEIKEINKKFCDNKASEIQKRITEIEVKLEGETIDKKEMKNSTENAKESDFCPNSRQEDLSPDFRQNNLCDNCKMVILCPECELKSIKNKRLCEQCGNIVILDVDEEQGQRQFESINAPFIGNKEEEKMLGTNVVDELIESIFEKLKSDDIYNDYNNLKMTLEELKENDKNEVIESIRIKIDNEEQENRFNNLLKLLF